MKSRSGNHKLKPLAKSHIVISDVSRSSLCDTLFYAFDIESEGGFIMIAAPKCVEPILAIVEGGSFDNPDNDENDSYQFVVENIKDDIRKTIIINRPEEPGRNIQFYLL